MYIGFIFRVQVICHSHTVHINATMTNERFILLENGESATASVFVVGTDGVCPPSDGHCNGYLDHGLLYRYTFTYILLIRKNTIVTGRWFSSGTPASSTIKTDRHNIT